MERIEPDSIVLAEGTVPTDADTLHVDCTANGLQEREILPIWVSPYAPFWLRKSCGSGGERRAGVVQSEGRITLQSVQMCQQVFSSAVIAHIETQYSSAEEKNALVRPDASLRFDLPTRIRFDL